jgi:hypothetical protein
MRRLRDHASLILARKTKTPELHPDSLSGYPGFRFLRVLDSCASKREEG